jgi:hypothetical protein
MKCRLFFPIPCLALLFCSGPGASLVTAQSTSDPATPRTGAGSSVYQPISSSERGRWFLQSTVGPKSMAAGVVSAGWGTALNKPEEYGPHWEGFAKRYGMRLTGVATGNAIEAGLGTIWNEDPRYVPSTETRPWPRLRHAAAEVFLAPRADGHQAPAFARYSGIVGGNFISNSWRVPSESTVTAALTRSALGFAGRFASNLFDEFWKDIRRKGVSRKGGQD